MNSPNDAGNFVTSAPVLSVAPVTVPASQARR